MTEVILIIHLFLAIALIGSVLLQRSEGGALGIGGGTMGGMMTARGSANLMTRATGIIAACFLSTSLLLAVLSSSNKAPTSILDRPAATGAPSAPATNAPVVPVVPLAK